MSQEQKFEFAISKSLQDEWNLAAEELSKKTDLTSDLLTPVIQPNSTKASSNGSNHYVVQLNFLSPPKNSKKLTPFEYFLSLGQFESAQQIIASFFANNHNENNNRELDLEYVKSLCLRLIEENSQIATFAYYHLAFISHQQNKYTDAKNYLIQAAQQPLDNGTGLDRRFSALACLQIADLHDADYKTIPLAVYLFKAAYATDSQGLKTFFNNPIKFESPSVKETILQFLAAILYRDPVNWEKVATTYQEHIHDEKVIEFDFTIMRNFKNALLGKIEDPGQFFSFTDILNDLLEQSPENKEFIFTLFLECVKANIPHSSLVQDFISITTNDKKLSPLCQNIREDVIFYQKFYQSNQRFNGSYKEPITVPTKISENPVFQFKNLFYSSLSDMSDFFKKIIKPIWAQFFSYKSLSPLQVAIKKLQDDFEEFLILKNDALLTCSELPTEENNYNLELDGKISIIDYIVTVDAVLKRLEPLKKSCEILENMDPANNWAQLSKIIDKTQENLRNQRMDMKYLEQKVENSYASATKNC